MSDASDYLEQAVGDDLFGISAFTVPGTVYLALSTADPTDDASGLTEPSGNGYSRTSVTNTSASWQRSGSRVENKSTISCGTPTGGTWGTITHVAIMDASSSGNMLFSIALTSSLATAVGSPVEFAAGALGVTVA